MKNSDLKKRIQELSKEELLEMLSSAQIFQIGSEADKISIINDVKTVIESEYKNTFFGNEDMEDIYLRTLKNLSLDGSNEEYDIAVRDAVTTFCNENPLCCK